MACRMFGAKPLSKLMLPYWQLDPTEHISEILLKIQSFHSSTWKFRLRHDGLVVSALMC